jgi:3-methyladenine DNA glycosylase AlkD
MAQYVESIKSLFSQNSNTENAFFMKKYMKNKFEFYGIKSPLRNELCKPFLKKENLPELNDIKNIIIELWNEPERELQYFAMELLSKYSKHLKEEDYQFFEFLITNKSWWDSIDYISPNLVAKHFRIFPHLIKPISANWVNSNSIWLQRSAILFQLKSKKETDTDLLFKYIIQLSSSKEFFIRKAIGWALREYSKTNPNMIIEFVEKNENLLSGLSKREALKVINNKG